MNNYLETAIAVILLIIIFSVIAYVIQELVAANLEYRGKMLKGSIQLLLDGQAANSPIADKIYGHPQIKKLKEKVDKLPSYVPAANFALALIDEVARVAPNAKSDDLFINFHDGISSFASSGGDLEKLLKNYFNTSKDLKELQSNIEKWYNEYMDRVTGWYKKNSRITLRIIAVLVAIGFNVDLIKTTKAINGNDNLRASMISTADKLADQPQYIKKLYEDNIASRIALVTESHQEELAKADKKDTLSIQNKIELEKEAVLKNYTQGRIVDIDSLLNKIDSKELPIGWSKKAWGDITKTGSSIAWTILGWLLAALAISMGAPFWFELLIKLVNIRRAGLKPKDTIN